MGKQKTERTLPEPKLELKLELAPSSACVRAAIETMRRKLPLLYTMRRLTDAEFGYINGDSMEQLGNTLAERQELIKEIDMLDERFLREYGELKEAFGVESAEEIPAGAVSGTDCEGLLAEMKSATNEIMGVLTDISDLDAQIAEKMATLRASLTADMERLRHQRHVSGIYGADVRNPTQGAKSQPQTQSQAQTKTQALARPGTMFDKKK